MTQLTVSGASVQEMFKRCIKPSGPITSKIMLIGEAPGKSEEMIGLPFVGAAGQELDRMLSQAKIETHQAYKTNVFHIRPFKNDLLEFSGPKSEGLEGIPPIKAGKYVRKEFQFEYDRLQDEITMVKPNLIVALGNVALGAVLGISGISKARGTVYKTSQGHKCLPTYHPAAVLRQWEYRPIVVADFIKAKREMEYPEVRIPSRKVMIDPSIHDIELCYENNLSKAKYLSVDIETKHRQIRCIGFAWTPFNAIVIPFTDWRQSDYSYWRSKQEEKKAWEIVRKVLAGTSVKIFQNGLYDVQYLWRTMGIPTLNWREDTMIQHHALYPEMPKDLGFLGSIYTDEPSWKLMRPRASDLIKRDE